MEKMDLIVWKGRKGMVREEGEVGNPGQGVYLKDSQFVFDKFLLLNKQALSVKLWDYPKVVL